VFFEPSSTNGPKLTFWCSVKACFCKIEVNCLIYVSPNLKIMNYESVTNIEEKESKISFNTVLPKNFYFAKKKESDTSLAKSKTWPYFQSVFQKVPKWTVTISSVNDRKKQTKSSVKLFFGVQIGNRQENTPKQTWVSKAGQTQQIMKNKRFLELKKEITKLSFTFVSQAETKK
jgi:hypothetical protein